MSNTYTIKSTHDSLDSAINAAGGLNREYNAADFDKEVEAVSKNASEFYVVELLGRNEVLYKYECDISLLNKFTPYGGCLNNSMTVGIMLDGVLNEVFTVNKTKQLRKNVAKMQKSNKEIFVFNF